MAKQPDDRFKFQRNDVIGAAGAEEDTEFLRACFVDTGDLSILADTSDIRLIVLGRTGAGKSALFERLKETQGDRVIEIKPESLALTYVANSSAINAFSALGINLDPFFALLWRHVFTVEILTHCIDSPPSEKNTGFWDNVLSLFQSHDKKDREMQEAVSYLRQWGEEFWKETDHRVKDITKKMEVELSDAIKASLGGKYASVGINSSDLQKLSVEEKSELVIRGQEVVSRTQVKDLTQVLKLLGSVLDDRQKRYYVIVDRLDVNWVEEKLRYRLIMALIQIAKEFIKVSNAKIVIALRRDLIDRVFRLARESGFQEEKFQSLYVQLHWSKAQILDVLNKRVNHLVKRRYTKKEVSYKDVLPNTFHSLLIDDYIYDLCRRPRDVIAFFNACIKAGVDQPVLTAKQVSIAEGEYSRGRLTALADEWSADHPLLVDFSAILSNRQSTFKLQNITDKEVEDLCLDVISNNPDGKGILHEGAKAVVDQIQEPGQFRITLFQVLYRIGMVGLKTSSYDSCAWSDDGANVTRLQIDDDTSVTVSPPYVRALGVNDKIHRSY